MEPVEDLQHDVMKAERTIEHAIRQRREYGDSDEASRNAASGAKISDASVSRHEMNAASIRQKTIRSGSVMAPP